jgi:hypothetical protein
LDLNLLLQNSSIASEAAATVQLSGSFSAGVANVSAVMSFPDADSTGSLLNRIVAANESVHFALAELSATRNCFLLRLVEHVRWSVALFDTPVQNNSTPTNVSDILGPLEWRAMTVEYIDFAVTLIDMKPSFELFAPDAPPIALPPISLEVVDVTVLASSSPSPPLVAQTAVQITYDPMLGTLVVVARIASPQPKNTATVLDAIISNGQPIVRAFGSAQDPLLFGRALSQLRLDVNLTNLGLLQLSSVNIQNVSDSIELAVDVSILLPVHLNGTIEHERLYLARTSLSTPPIEQNAALLIDAHASLHDNVISVTGNISVGSSTAAASLINQLTASNASAVASGDPAYSTLLGAILSELNLDLIKLLNNSNSAGGSTNNTAVPPVIIRDAQVVDNQFTFVRLNCSLSLEALSAVPISSELDQVSLSNLVVRFFRLPSSNGQPLAQLTLTVDYVPPLLLNVSAMILFRDHSEIASFVNRAIDVDQPAIGFRTDVISLGAQTPSFFTQLLSGVALPVNVNMSSPPSPANATVRSIPPVQVLLATVDADAMHFLVQISDLNLAVMNDSTFVTPTVEMSLLDRVSCPCVFPPPVLSINTHSSSFAFSRN